MNSGRRWPPSGIVPAVSVRRAVVSLGTPLGFCVSVRQHALLPIGTPVKRHDEHDGRTTHMTEGTA